MNDDDDMAVDVKHGALACKYRACLYCSCVSLLHVELVSKLGIQSSSCVTHVLTVRLSVH